MPNPFFASIEEKIAADKRAATLATEAAAAAAVAAALQRGTVRDFPERVSLSPIPATDSAYAAYLAEVNRKIESENLPSPRR